MPVTNDSDVIPANSKAITLFYRYGCVWTLLNLSTEILKNKNIYRHTP